MVLSKVSRSNRCRTAAAARAVLSKNGARAIGSVHETHEGLQRFGLKLRPLSCGAQAVHRTIQQCKGMHCEIRYHQRERTDRGGDRVRVVGLRVVSLAWVAVKLRNET